MFRFWCGIINVVSLNPCDGPTPKIKISLFFLSICRDELISTPKVIIFFFHASSVNENSEREPNPMSYELYFYLSRSVSVASFTDPNKQQPNEKSVFSISLI